jgi:hypothetical protein
MAKKKIEEQLKEELPENQDVKDVSNFDNSDNPYDGVFSGKKAVMLNSLEYSLGVVTDAARLAGISRETHYNWMREDEAYKAAVEEIKDVSIDFVESHLFKQIKAETKGSASLIQFYLKTIGKKRGYQTEINVNQKTTHHLDEKLSSLADDKLKMLMEIGTEIYGDPATDTEEEGGVSEGSR